MSNPSLVPPMAFAAAIAMLAALAGDADAQQVLVPASRDPMIRAIVGEVSSDRIEADIRRLAGFGTRHTFSVTDDPNRGIGAARRWLRGELEAIAEEGGGRLVIEEDRFTQEGGSRIPRPVEIVNLVATLPGVQDGSRDRTYVVAAHYDSIAFPYDDAEIDAPGANDDASGTAAVLELARVLGPREFDATLVFLLVAGEEQGLHGSRHWAERAAEEGREIAGMFTNDIIGNTLGGNGVRDATRVRVFSEGVPTSETERQARLRRSLGGENDGPSRQLARFIKAVGEAYVPPFEVSLVYRRDRYGRGGDHIAFLEQGYPAVRFTEPNEDYRRQHRRVEVRDGIGYGDVVERVDFDYVADVARVNAAALAMMAMAPAKPSGVRFDSLRQSYDATLTWRAATEPDIAGYRVVWRDSSATDWTDAIEIGPVQEATLPGLSKDDTLFAVQAVDEGGHVSVPAYPGVGRR